MTDARLTPARADVAAAHLKGQVQAARFAEGVVWQVNSGVSCLHEAPSSSARLETQLLRGEIFRVYDEADGWFWGQSALDGYVGYARAEDFGADIEAPTHRVAALRTVIFPEPNIKSRPTRFLSLNAKVHVAAMQDRFAHIGDGYVVAAHLTPIEARINDWVSSAEWFLRTPYLWGGKDSFGLDCSGLVQTALETGGIASPRDSDQQEAALDRCVNDRNALQRGDLVFWRGHVGVMRDAHTLLHASGFHMMVACEPLVDAVARIAASDGDISSIKRL